MKKILILCLVLIPSVSFSEQSNEFLNEACAKVVLSRDLVAKYLLISENHFIKKEDGTFERVQVEIPNRPLIFAVSSLSDKCGQRDMKLNDLDLVSNLNAIRNNIWDPVLQSELQDIMCRHYWILNGESRFCN